MMSYMFHTKATVVLPVGMCDYNIAVVYQGHKKFVNSIGMSDLLDICGLSISIITLSYPICPVK